VLAAPYATQLGGGDRIATSYPTAWSRFADTTGSKCQLGRIMKGKVESAPARGLAEAIYDITETGRSLKENDLEIKQLGPQLALGGLWKRI
jgi:ATP phosphoribosyltransferase